MSAVIEKQKPNWPPGTAYGYHAVTFGWVVDQIVRRADPAKRGLGHFFKEEVADKYGILLSLLCVQTVNKLCFSEGVDFTIGLPLSKWHRMARTTIPNFWHTLQAFESWEFAKLQAKIFGHAMSEYLSGTNQSLLMRVFQNPDFLFIPGSVRRFCSNSS